MALAVGGCSAALQRFPGVKSNILAAEAPENAQCMNVVWMMVFSQSVDNGLDSVFMAACDKELL